MVFIKPIWDTHLSECPDLTAAVQGGYKNYPIFADSSRIISEKQRWTGNEKHPRTRAKIISLFGSLLSFLDKTTAFVVMSPCLLIG